MYRWNKVSK